jgi:hypothetical protein
MREARDLVYNVIDSSLALEFYGFGGPEVREGWLRTASVVSPAS